ncbi:metallophosphoesterase [Novipirellula sp.]|uniref:metallophosphoesterase n=1 Tax=Novipirellula sp. TaxID=2795430 RepID=UPI00356B02A0
MQRPIKIVHLTDLHFGPQHQFQDASNGVQHQRSLLQMLVDDVQSLRVEPDLLIISGDFVSFGQESEFHKANDFLVQLVNAWNLSKSDVLLCPGNHDVTWTTNAAEPSHGNFRTFASLFYKCVPSEIELRACRIGDVYAICLDSNLVESEENGGQGFVGLRQLAHAKSKVLTEATDSAIKLLVLHHHLLPVNWCDEVPSEGNHNSATLDTATILAWAQEIGFNAVLHGHQHESFISTFHRVDRLGGPLAVIGGPSAGGKDLPPQGRNGYQILTVDAESIAIDVRLLDTSSQFVSVKEVSFIVKPSGTFASTAFPGTLDVAESSELEVLIQIKSVAEKVADVVGRSFGPVGGLRGVADLNRAQHMKDGVGIVESLSAENSVQQRVIETFITLARDATDRSGNGRKTAMLIAAKAVTEAVPLIQQGASRSELCGGIELAIEQIVLGIRNLSQDAKSRDQTKAIAMTASNGDSRMSSILVEAIEKAGGNGLVRFVESQSVSDVEFDLKVQEHPTFPVREIPKWFSEKNESGKLTTPLFFVTLERSISRNVLVRLLEYAGTTKRPIIIATPEIESLTAEFCGANGSKGTVVAIPLHMGGYGEKMHDLLRDLAVLTGANEFSSELGSRAAESVQTFLGEASSAVLSNFSLTIEGGASKDKRMLSRVKALQREAEYEVTNYGRENMEERRARLIGRIVNLDIGGVSNAERALNYSLVQDAFASVRQAMLEGFVPGGGVALACATKSAVMPSLTHDQARGWDCFANATSCPYEILSREKGGLLQNPIDPTSQVVGSVKLAADTAIRLLRTVSFEVGAKVKDRSSANGKTNE